MHSFSILNSRKRAIIALIHTVIFLGVAALQTALSHAKAFSLHGDKAVGGIVLLTIYTIVTTVLLILLKMASHASERLYFALCATSAALGPATNSVGRSGAPRRSVACSAAVGRSGRRDRNLAHASRPRDGNAPLRGRLESASQLRPWRTVLGPVSGHGFTGC